MKLKLAIISLLFLGHPAAAQEILDGTINYVDDALDRMHMPGEQVVVYAQHYCRWKLRIDIDGDGVTVTTNGKTERFHPVLEYPNLVLVGKNGKREPMQFYYGTINYDGPIIFRDKVIWPCIKEIDNPTGAFPE